MSPGLQRALGRPETPSVVFLLVLTGALAAAAHGFFTPANLLAVATQAAVVGVVALGLNQVILAGEIDVSVGSLLAVCASVFVTAAGDEGQRGPVVGLIAALAVGTAAGGVTGLLVTVGRAPSIVVSLGMLLLLRGLVLLAGADGVKVTPDTARGLGLGTVLGVPAPVLILIALLVALVGVGRETVWGREVLAVGGNPRAAEAVGLRAGRVKWAAFALTGACCGLAGAIFAGQIGEVQATAGSGFELSCIAAVVLGGTSITGGRGSAAAPVLGALLVGVVLNGLTLAGVPATFEQLALGVMILAAVSVDAVRRRLAETAR